MNRIALKVLIVVVVGALIAAFFALGFDRYLTLEYVKQQQEAFQSYYDDHPVKTIAIFMAGYVVAIGLSIPGATVLALAAGALFGVVAGTVIVSFASSIGATLAFLAARFVLKDFVQNRYGNRLRKINEGIERDGPLYLFTLRLVPIFPFFVINLAMALTPIRVLPYYLVSQMGMLPGTAVYVNAGTQLGQLESLEGIFSADLLLSFALLGIFPLIARKIVDLVKPGVVLRKYDKPSSYDYNLVVIGAGSAGLVSSYIGATVGARVALVEKTKMGGDCLNTGCVPSKALIRSARMLSYARRAEEFGFDRVDVTYDFSKVMERVQRVIRTVEPHDSVERFTELGVDVLIGEATIRSPFRVEVTTSEGKRTLTTKSIVVASGAEPLVPPIDGIEEAGYWTSDTIWSIRERPERLLVLGGGPIGCELARTFQRLGCQVTQVEAKPRLLSKEDEDVSALLEERFRQDGVRLMLEHRAARVERRGEQRVLVCDGPDGEVAVEFDALLVALGRKPRTSGFGLEELDVYVSDKGTIGTDELLRTNIPNIYVCGDVAGPYQFTHTAAHQAWYASVNALFSPLKTFKVNYDVIPWCTYTDPEVAHVGLNEQQAREQGVDYEVTCYGIDDLDRAIAEDEAHGFVKVLTPPGKDKILGVTLVGEHAGDLIVEYILAMRRGIGLKKILGTIHIYPTLAEANKFAAGEWAKAHKPERALRLLARFFSWRRA